VIVTLLASVAQANPSRDPAAALADGKLAYQKHDYQAVESTVRPLLEAGELTSDDALLEAHRLLALAYFFQKKQVEARREVVAIYGIKPNYELDRYVEPPTAVTFFETIRREQEDRLAEIRRRELEEDAERRRREDELRKKMQPKVVLVPVQKRSRLVAAVPFGLGQWQNGHKRAAIAFLTLELITGALSLATWATLQAQYPKGTFPPDDKALVQGLVDTQLVAAGVFWGLVVTGIIEAQVRFKPTDAPKTAVVPFLSPNGAGLAVKGAF
jgi:hypothetical protein